MSYNWVIMKELIAILKTELEPLRMKYLSLTEKYITNVWKHNQRLIKESWEYWYKNFNLPIEIKEQYNYATMKKEKKVVLVRGAYNTKKYFDMIKARNKVIDLDRIGLNDFTEKTMNNAKQHYENSIEKLAYRIKKKGLNISKLKATTSYIDVNISTILTDGEKTVRAWTIIASGSIQRPHYRYLIK